MAYSCRWQGLDLRRLRAHLLSINSKRPLFETGVYGLLSNRIISSLTLYSKPCNDPNAMGQLTVGPRALRLLENAPPTPSSRVFSLCQLSDPFIPETELIYDAISNTLSKKFSRDESSLHVTVLQRMPPRLSHRKSTMGCLRCKARKVKVSCYTVIPWLYMLILQ